MKSLFVFFILLATTHSHAYFTDICEEKDDDLNFLRSLSKFADVSSPSMDIKYKLTKACDYTVTSNVEFPSSLSTEQVIQQLLDTKVNLTVGDKNKLVSYEYKSGVQTTKAKKSGVTATVVSNCTTTANSFNCKTDTSKSTAMGKELFAYNNVSVNCSEAAAGMKKCKFETKGKAKGMILKGSCSLAAGGAVETFEATHRMIQYLSSGSIKSGSNSKLNEFYKKASEDKNVGKGEVNISMSIQ